MNEYKGVIIIVISLYFLKGYKLMCNKICKIFVCDMLVIFCKVFFVIVFSFFLMDLLENFRIILERK